MKDNWDLLYNQTRNAAISAKDYGDNLKKVIDVFIKTFKGVAKKME